ENAIREWFKNKEEVFNEELSKAMREDFLKFEGNAQTLRILTRLQIVDHEFGLDLTCGTLAALIKYPTPSDQTSKSNAATKKSGFFQSEKEIVDEIWAQTGLTQGRRHPLTYIMEACDDIAYSVLDVEDAVKKSLVSCSDVLDYLSIEHKDDPDPIISRVVEQTREKWTTYRKLNLSPSELNELTMQRFRVYALNELITAATDTFTKNHEAILSGQFSDDLISCSAGAKLCKGLKKFAFVRAYKHRSVLEIELKGHHVIQTLMDYFWHAICKEDTDNATPFSKYIYSRISENYRRVSDSENTGLPRRYRRLQLVTDMVSGMTDGYAIALWRELKELDYDDVTRKV
ncbi:MAG: dGTP triphosphohydrolase, partial [Myxococcota bacterium]